MHPTTKTPLGATLRVIRPQPPHIYEGQLVTLTGHDGKFARISGGDRPYSLERFEVVDTSTLAPATPSDPRYAALRKAAAAVYLAGKWTLQDQTPPTEQAKLWEDLRIALGFQPGYSA